MFSSFDNLEYRIIVKALPDGGESVGVHQVWMSDTEEESPSSWSNDPVNMSVIVNEDWWEASVDDLRTLMEKMEEAFTEPAYKEIEDENGELILQII